jgi:hypothetical protein
VVGKVAEVSHHGKCGGGGILVELQPVAANLLEGRSELVVGDRFLNTAVGPQLVALSQLTGIIGRGEDDYGNHAGSRIRAHCSEDLDPIHPGQLEPEEDQAGWQGHAAVPVSPAAEEKVERLFSISSDFDVAGGMKLLQGPQCELHLQWTFLD